jgi:hypothetical protein
LERHQREKGISCDVLAITSADKAPQRQNKIELKKTSATYILDYSQSKEQTINQ